MCRTILILSLLLLILPVKAQPKYEVRAAWITAVYGLDWPRTRATTPQTIRKQKEELVDILDKLKAANFNTVLFHRIYELDQTGRRYYNILKRKISQCKTRMHFTRSGKHSSILLQQFKEAIRLGSVLRSRRLCNIRIHLSPIGVLILSRKNKKNAL